MSFKMSFSEPEEEDIEEIPTAEKKPTEVQREEGQWRNITDDILSLILKRLNTQADLCRFRSICKSWRLFASPSQAHILFPLSLPPLHQNSRTFSLSPTLLYILSPKVTLSAPAIQQKAWLVKVAETGERRWDLLNPLTKHKLYFSRKRVNFNLLGFRNLEVGRSYRLQLASNSAEDDSTFDFEEFSSSLSVRKAVVNLGVDKVSVLGLFNYGEIALWNWGDDKWKIIQAGEKKENDFDDVICYDGRFFAVDRKGRLVMINLKTFELDEVAAPMEECNGMYTYLVEANFKLYLVNKVVNTRPMNYLTYDEEEEEWVVDKSMVGKPLGFKIFVLNEKEKNWEKVSSLGKMVFFVSRDAAFSVNAEDLGRSKGNCIYFEGLTGYDDEADMGFGLNAGVYTLEDEVITTFDPSTVANTSGDEVTGTLDSTADRWTEIFWPPSSWFMRNDDYPEYEMQD